MSNLFRQTIIKDCEILNIKITKSIIEKFEIYYNILYKKNNEYNLTAIINPVEAAEKHFIDSLTLYDEINLYNGKIIDIGSGAGFPGLPLKIYKEELNMTLVDAVGKKVRFIQKVIQTLKLQNINAIQARIEDFASKEREEYFIAVSRAVAELRILVEYSLPLIQVGGFFITTKGPNIKDEIEHAEKAIEILGGEIKKLKKINLPISKEGRTIIIIKKIKNTPIKYPRRVGIPKKRPL